MKSVIFCLFMSVFCFGQACIECVSAPTGMIEIKIKGQNGGADGDTPYLFVNTTGEALLNVHLKPNYRNFEEYWIHDVRGVLKKHEIMSSTNSCVINISDLNAGKYVISVNDNSAPDNPEKQTAVISATFTKNAQANNAIILE